MSGMLLHLCTHGLAAAPQLGRRSGARCDVSDARHVFAGTRPHGPYTRGGELWPIVIVSTLLANGKVEISFDISVINNAFWETGGLTVLPALHRQN